MRPIAKAKKSFRLSAEASRLLEILANRWGLTRTGVLELVIRQTAERHPTHAPDPREPTA